MKRSTLLGQAVLMVLMPTHSELYAADWHLLRRVAQVGACAASIGDAASISHPGIREANPILGQGSSVVGIKLGVCVGQVALSEWMSRRRPDWDRTTAVVSFGEAGLYTGLAIRNSRIK